MWPRCPEGTTVTASSAFANSDSDSAVRDASGDLSRATEMCLALAAASRRTRPACSPARADMGERAALCQEMQSSGRAQAGVEPASPGCRVQQQRQQRQTASPDAGWLQFPSLITRPRAASLTALVEPRRQPKKVDRIRGRRERGDFLCGNLATWIRGDRSTLQHHPRRVPSGVSLMHTRRCCPLCGLLVEHGGVGREGERGRGRPPTGRATAGAGRAAGLATW
ncbi:unnamed protein product [Lampetra planeri]